jgi:DNA-binding transcriptional regulator YhcF (GntR family)
MTSQFTPVTSGARLSDQVAQQLTAQIHAGRLEAGEKLPTEARLVEQFQVSRTVLREAVSRLKSLGLVDSRQGSGVYVSASPPYAPLNFDARHSESREAVVQMAEVRRALEAEAAGLAAQRRKAADVKCLKQAVQALDRAVKSGGDGVTCSSTARSPMLRTTPSSSARSTTWRSSCAARSASPVPTRPAGPTSRRRCGKSTLPWCWRSKPARWPRRGLRRHAT